MSFQAMSWAVEKQLPANQKLVLLMLANFAGDHGGNCYPSHDRLAEDCGMSKTTVKECIKRLADAGLLTVIHRSTDGVNLPNYYRIHVDYDGLRIDRKVGRQPTHPVGMDLGVGRQPTDGGAPADRGVGRQPTTNQSIEPINEPINQPEWLDPQAWDGFVAMRKKIKKPLSGRALELALKSLAKMREEGQDPNAVLDQSTMNCWQGLFPVKGEPASAGQMPKRMSDAAAQTLANGASLRKRLFGGGEHAGA